MVHVVANTNLTTALEARRERVKRAVRLLENKWMRRLRSMPHGLYRSNVGRISSERICGVWKYINCSEKNDYLTAFNASDTCYLKITFIRKPKHELTRKINVLYCGHNGMFRRTYHNNQFLARTLPHCQLAQVLDWFIALTYCDQKHFPPKHIQLTFLEGAARFYLS